MYGICTLARIAGKDFCSSACGSEQHRLASKLLHGAHKSRYKRCFSRSGITAQEKNLSVVTRQDKLRQFVE